MQLLMATNNPHKAREIREILGERFDALLTLADAGLALDVVEDGLTFEQNAVKKAEEVLRASGFDAVIADDSGLEVDALHGAPGVHSARYAGEAHDDVQNNEKLMRDMRDVPWEHRGCHFVCAVALARTGRPTLCVRGTVDGRLLAAPRGKNGFGYDPYFYYEPLSRSFAELTAEQKNGVSHRRNALHALLRALSHE